MLRAVTQASRALLRPSVNASAATVSAAPKRLLSSEENADKFDQRFIEYFNRADIDGWEVRKGMTELQNADLIPDPKIVAAALRACRRVNDFSLAVRFLEGVKIKCTRNKSHEQIYPYIIQEVSPVLEELGLSTPEDLGYDQPELFIPEPQWWWEREWYTVYGYDKKPGYSF